MTNKRVVFVCFDEAYVGTIECKLAELLADKLELEFITTESYLMKFVQSVHQIDILLISKEYEYLLGDEFSATKVIWLTENKELEEREQTQGDEYIYLYASVRKMVDRIDSRILTDGQMTGKNGTQVISVYSVCGGCGKTMTAVGTAYALAREGNKVLYVSTESMQDFKYYIPGIKEITSDFGYQCAVDMDMAKRCILNEIEHGEIDYLRPFSVLPMAYQVNTDKYLELIEGVIESNTYDYIIVELSKEIEPQKIAFMQKSRKIILVTTQGDRAVAKLQDFINGVTRFAVPPLIVCNHFDTRKKDYLTDSRLKEQCEIAEYIMEAEDDISWETVKNNLLFEKVAALL